jgi:N-acetylneuraminic acid mutarotase
VKDTYAYDAASDTWAEKAPFTGVERNGTIGFSIGNIGYVGGGNDGTNNSTDFYKFDLQ